MHDFLLLLIICAKSLSAYNQPHSPTTFKIKHIEYIKHIQATGPGTPTAGESKYFLASVEDPAHR